jgi:hypothetical protein
MAAGGADHSTDERVLSQTLHGRGPKYDRWRRIPRNAASAIARGDDPAARKQATKVAARNAANERAILSIALMHMIRKASCARRENCVQRSALLG